MKNFYFFSFFFPLILISFQLIAQDNQVPEKHAITLHTGKEYIGVILQDDGREVLIDSDNIGKVFLKKSDIRSIVLLKDSANQLYFGEYMPEGVFTTRYSFATNALPITKGDNYTLTHLYGPEVHFSLTDRFSLGAMTTWIGSPMVLAAKYSFKKEESKVNFALGTLMGTSSFIGSFRGYGGLHWGTVTFGDRANNLSLSAGYAYMQLPIERFRQEPGIYDSNYAIPGKDVRPFVQGPVFGLAGIARVGAKTSFVFDSMVFLYENDLYNADYVEVLPPDYSIDPPFYGEYQYIVTKKSVKSLGVLLMPGLRFQTTERKAFQVTMSGVSINQGERVRSFPVPMLSWFYKL